MFVYSEEEEKSSLHLTIAGTEEGILMIEGQADFLPEETIIEALQVRWLTGKSFPPKRAV